MGCNILKRSCYTNENAIAPNPSPDNWTLLDLYQMKNAYVMRVKYNGCTNFEGVKVMVYKGQYVEREWLDPHFSMDDSSPIARFNPSTEGLQMALALGESI